MGALVTVRGKKTDDMVTVKEAAVILGAGVSTIIRYIATGKIQACKVNGSKAYYILLDDLNDFEKNGSIRTRNRKKKKAAEPELPRDVQIINAMSEESLRYLLSAVSATAKLFNVLTDPEQIEICKGTIMNVIDGPLRESLLKTAPEFFEE